MYVYFSWIVQQNKWGLLHGFPVFVDKGDSDGQTVLHMLRNADDSERLLAPARAWSEDLHPFSDLFPPTRVLADAFFEAVPGSDTWQILEEQRFIRTNILTTE